MRYTRQQHLRKEADFHEIRASGIRRECGFFYLNLLELPGREPPLRRAGFIASRRVGNAVRRNRARRLMREAFRHQQDLLPPSCDLVMVARPSISRARSADIERRLAGAIKSLPAHQA
ncbi:MAG: ribonuclease P protein component [Oceanipulchritudo sp.]